MARKGLLVITIMLAVLMVGASIPDNKETHQYALDFTVGSELSQADGGLHIAQQPTPVSSAQPSAIATLTTSPQAAPGANWLIWIGLAVIVVGVLAMLMTRKPTAS